MVKNGVGNFTVNLYPPLASPPIITVVSGGENCARCESVVHVRNVRSHLFTGVYTVAAVMGYSLYDPAGSNSFPHSSYTDCPICHLYVLLTCESVTHFTDGWCYLTLGRKALHNGRCFSRTNPLTCPSLCIANCIYPSLSRRPEVFFGSLTTPIQNEEECKHLMPSIPYAPEVRRGGG